MLSEHFDQERHTIIFRSPARAEEVLETFDLKVMFLHRRKDFLKQMPPLIIGAEIILFHSFPVSRSLLFWYRYRKYMSRAIWSVWGQDAYWFDYCRKSAANLLFEWIRHRLIRKLGAILCPIRGDYDYIRNRYKTKAVYIEGMYPIPTDFVMLRALREKPSARQTLNIQVGNSANPTNNTLEVLSFLAQRKTGPERVYCPLSYGDQHYAQQVIDFGRRVLAERFFPLTIFLKREEYADFISTIDVLIMNHHRQQGLGNILSYLYLGKKVYIRRNNTSFSFFEEHGIKVFDTCALLEQDSLDQLFEMEEEVGRTNMRQTESIISMEWIKQGWGEAFSLKTNISNG